MLPRDKSRAITIDGRAYRWLVSSSAARSLLIVVTAEGERARLEVTLSCEIPGLYWLPDADIQNGPSELSGRNVSALIKRARSAGWLTQQGGETFRYPVE